MLKQKSIKKYIALGMSMILTFGVMGTMAPATAVETEAAYTKSEGAVVIKAKSGPTVFVEGTESETSESNSLRLRARGGMIEIKRDYSQEINIDVTNNSGEVQRYYVTAKNPYDDLSLEVIASGSKSEPLSIAPGETQSVLMKVFAQNAQKSGVNDWYQVPVSLYVINGDTEKLADTDISEFYIEDQTLNLTADEINTDDYTNTTLQL